MGTHWVNHTCGARRPQLFLLAKMHLVNAYYSSSPPAITIPAGILQSVFFHPDRPAAMNYAAIGVVIGHEVGHAFDDDGAKTDHLGKEGEWWSEQERAAFDAKSKCLEQQYSGIYDHRVGMTVNGAMTLGENIADNGGLRQATLAFQRSGDRTRLPHLNLTVEQLFYISYAGVWCGSKKPEQIREAMKEDVHTLGEYRVNVPTSNSRGFAAAFGCTHLSPWRRGQRCSLW